MSTTTQDHEELIALWLWIQSFPVVSSAVFRAGIDPCIQPEIPHDFIQGCLDNIEITSAILSTAEEIKCSSSPIERHSANDASDLWTEIFCMFDLDKKDYLMLESDWRCPALRSMLCYAVSDACDKREEYIPRILALSVNENYDMFRVDGVDVQRILMRIISRGMDTEPEHTSDEEEQHTRNNHKLNETEGEVDRADKSNDENNEAHDVKVSNCTWKMKNDDIILRLEQELKLAREENEILKIASYDATKRENDLSFEVESLKANYRLWTLKEEAAFLDRERLTKEKYDSDIDQLKSQLDDLAKRCEEGEKAKAELVTLRDDLDVLQHLETKLLFTEDQLRKYKEKLQEFSDVRAQLSREEEAHGKAVAQILVLESELAQLQPLKRQLDVYRARATDAEVKLAQCQHSLEKFQHLTKHLALENTELATTSKARINETEQLRQKLECPTSDDSFISSLGEGFSELNPVLKEEILRLRSENRRLMLSVSKHTEAAVMQLEEKMDDSARLADSFKKQFLHTLTQLETTQNELQSTLEVVSTLKAEINEWSQKFAELECVLSDERIQNLEARKQAEDKFEQETRELLEKAESELAEKESLWNDLLESERNDAQHSLDAVFNKLKETTDRYNYELSQLREETRVLIEAEKHNSSTKIQQLMLEHSEAIDVLKQEAANEREELMKKGKAMIASKKEKVENFIRKLKEDHDAEMSRMKSLYANFCEKQIAYEEKATKKITGYKAKLEVANGRICFLETEIDSLQLKQQDIEREKEKANEEAERLRRLVGSRMGAESDLELSFEKLRQEYSAMLEEQRLMKRQLSMAEFGENKVYANNEECSYHSPTSGSTITQLRAEYEDTIRLLNDEKRELVMKNSATVSDLQRMEQKTWQLEDVICRLKEELTSAHLKIQRSMINSEKLSIFSSLPLERTSEDAQGNELRLPLQRIEDNVNTLTRQQSRPTASLLKNNVVNVARGENMEETPVLNAATEVPECRQS